MLSLPQAKTTALALAIAFVVFLGMFLDTAPIALIIGPILKPVITALGYNPTWWGLVFCTTLLTAYITPPVGLGMFYFAGTVKDVTLSEIYRAVLPFLPLLILTVVAIVIFPDIALFSVKLLLGGK